MIPRVKILKYTYTGRLIYLSPVHSMLMDMKFLLVHVAAVQVADVGPTLWVEVEVSVVHIAADVHPLPKVEVLVVAQFAADVGPPLVVGIPVMM